MKFKHILLTMDMLLLDECGQLSAQQFATLDIILRNLRDTPLPFGGVLLIGTLDHAQLGPISGLPFLLSSHIVTDFTLIKLEHSVRAARDANLQEIQHITRMSPYDLRKDPKKRDYFRKLVKENFNFCDSFSSDEISPNHVKVSHKRKQALEAQDDLVDITKKALEQRNINYYVKHAGDFDKPHAALGGPKKTKSEATKRLLDKNLRGPRRLIFYPGALFEATQNTDEYVNSQLMLMLRLPSEEDLRQGNPIQLLKAKPGRAIPKEIFTWEEPGADAQQRYEAMGWEPVQVKCTDMTNSMSAYGVTASRIQYPLRPLGTSTVNKTMGATLKAPIAIEVKGNNRPWEQGLVVVELSRNEECSSVWIVCDSPDEAVDLLLDAMCRPTQWTRMIEAIVNKVAISLESETSERPRDTALSIAELYPWRVSDFALPTSNSGFVYLLMSTVCPNQYYVGQADNLSKRIDEHNQGKVIGRGAKFTNFHHYIPWSVCAYIQNLGHMTVYERRRLENDWQRLNQLSRKRGGLLLEHLLENGEQVVYEYNEGNRDTPERFINMVKTIHPLQELTVQEKDKASSDSNEEVKQAADILFSMCNLEKRGLTLDVKSEECRDQIGKRRRLA